MSNELLNAAGSIERREKRQVKKVLVLGLGNQILCDDAIGLNVTREVGRRLAPEEEIDTLETEEIGLSLLDFVIGYRDLVLVDAVQTGRAPAGRLHELALEDLAVLPAFSPHSLGIGEVLALGRTLNLPVPDRVRIFAVEVESPYTLSSEMTPALQEAQARIVARVLAAVRELARA